MRAGQNNVGRLERDSASMLASGVGWVLLIAGVAATMWAALSERSDLQRWIARGYFGIDTEGRYKDMDKELLEYQLLAELVHKPMADGENQRLLKKYPAPPAAPPPRPPLDPWDPMNNGFGGSR